MVNIFIIYRVSYMSGGWPWDFWTISRVINMSFSFHPFIHPSSSRRLIAPSPSSVPESEWAYSKSLCHNEGWFLGLSMGYPEVEDSWNKMILWFYFEKNLSMCRRFYLPQDGYQAKQWVSGSHIFRLGRGGTNILVVAETTATFTSLCTHQVCK